MDTDILRQVKATPVGFTSDIKSEAAREIGEGLEALRDRLDLQAARSEGAAAALEKASVNCLGLHRHIDALVDDGKLDEFGNPLAVSKLLKDWITKAARQLEQQQKVEKRNAEDAASKSAGITEAINVPLKVMQREESTIKSLHDLVLSGSAKLVDGAIQMGESGDARRPTGVRPAPSLAARRRASGNGNGGNGGSDLAETAPPAAGTGPVSGAEPLADHEPLPTPAEAPQGATAAVVEASGEPVQGPETSNESETEDVSQKDPAPVRRRASPRRRR